MPIENSDILPPVTGDHAANRPRTESPVSVIVPCCGQLEYTKLCVSSLLRHSRRPYELIFVDLDSLDGTSEYLAGVQTAATIPLQVLEVSADVGFAGALTRGIASANGEFIVLLSNDTIVTQYWLEHLVALAESSRTIGVVGAMSNSAAPPQSVGSVPYRITGKHVSQSVNGIRNSRPLLETEPIDQFATQWGEQNRGQWFEADRLATFCLMFKRTILSLVLPLQPQSFFTFDADGVFRRIREAGYHIACCRDLFIPHFASRPAGRVAVAER